LSGPVSAALTPNLAFIAAVRKLLVALNAIAREWGAWQP
jgi:hypothetical protein